MKLYALRYPLYTSFITERAGFEPAVRKSVHTLSKRALSATQTPLQVTFKIAAK